MATSLAGRQEVPPAGAAGPAPVVWVGPPAPGLGRIKVQRPIRWKDTEERKSCLLRTSDRADD